MPISVVGRKGGKAGEERIVGAGELEVGVGGRPGVCPSFGGQQEQGIPGRQVPRGEAALEPSQPGGRL